MVKGPNDKRKRRNLFGIKKQQNITPFKRMGYNLAITVSLVFNFNQSWLIAMLSSLIARLWLPYLIFLVNIASLFMFSQTIGGTRIKYLCLIFGQGLSKQCKPKSTCS